MKVWKLIWKLAKMPLAANILLFTDYNTAYEDVREVIGIRLLEPDPGEGDLVEILHK